MDRRLPANRFQRVAINVGPPPGTFVRDFPFVHVPVVLSKLERESNGVYMVNAYPSIHCAVTHRWYIVFRAWVDP